MGKGMQNSNSKFQINSNNEIRSITRIATIFLNQVREYNVVFFETGFRSPIKYGTCGFHRAGI
jgi:hypothetical protein